MHVPEPEDAEDDDAPELAKPMVVVSSRSGAWPWIEWTAMTVAGRLGARVYDPQDGSFYRTGAPEHDLAALRSLHEVWFREVKPTLISSSWASGVGKPTAAGLREHVQAFESVAREVLGVDRPIVLSSDEQVNLRHTFNVDGSQLSVSSDMGSIYDRNPKRTLHVEGPSANAAVRAFTDALAACLSARFRSVEEYR